MQPFANVLENRTPSKFIDIRKKTSVLEFLFNKVTGLMAYKFIRKETPTQVLSCESHKMFENSFFMKCLWWLLLKMVVEFRRISNSTWEIFVQKNLLKRKICKDALYVVNEGMK